jgi:hypothetical protein
MSAPLLAVCSAQSWFGTATLAVWILDGEAVIWPKRWVVSFNRATVSLRLNILVPRTLSALVSTFTFRVRSREPADPAVSNVTQSLDGFWLIT